MKGQADGQDQIDSAIRIYILYIVGIASFYMFYVIITTAGVTDCYYRNISFI